MFVSKFIHKVKVLTQVYLVKTFKAFSEHSSGLEWLIIFLLNVTLIACFW